MKMVNPGFNHERHETHEKLLFSCVSWFNKAVFQV